MQSVIQYLPHSHKFSAKSSPEKWHVLRLSKVSVDGKIFYQFLNVLCVNQVHNYMIFGNIFLTGFLTKCILTRWKVYKVQSTSTKSHQSRTLMYGREKNFPLIAEILRVKPKSSKTIILPLPWLVQ